MRDRTAAQVASALAAGGQLAALPLLLDRHPRALAPSILDVLDCVPETVTAKQLAPLLRQVGGCSAVVCRMLCLHWGQPMLLHRLQPLFASRLRSGSSCCVAPLQVLVLRQPPPLPRPADWVETAAIAASLKEAGEFALLLATEPMAEASSGWRPPTQRQVAAWVCQRAQRMDSATGKGRGQCCGQHRWGVLQATQQTHAASCVCGCAPQHPVFAHAPSLRQACCPMRSRCWRRHSLRCTTANPVWAPCWQPPKSLCHL